MRPTQRIRLLKIGGKQAAEKRQVMTHDITLKIALDRATLLGPGKADLLEGIRDNGSIAAAGRRMSMSYKRAWQLIGTLNACFAEPVVVVTRGGSAGGGAELTPTGHAVLASYRRMQELTAWAVSTEVAALDRLMKPTHD